jgi:aminopeptidase N
LLEVKEKWAPEKGKYSLEISQSCPPTPGQETKKPFHIPIAIGLLPTENENNNRFLGYGDEERHFLELKVQKQSFEFPGFTTKPTLSFLRR